MASDGKKSFWKRGNGSKLPGRSASQTFHTRHTVSIIMLSRPQPVNSSSSSEHRSRSKTFEEFEKDTDDAWDEEAGDIKHLSTDAKLEFEHSGSNIKGGAQKCKLVPPPVFRCMYAVQHVYITNRIVTMYL